MKELRGVRRAVSPKLTRKDPNADVDEELMFHVERRATELEEEGSTPEAAWAQARREFGDPDKFRAECEEIDRGWEDEMRKAAVWDSIRQDLAYALRYFRNNKGQIKSESYEYDIHYSSSALSAEKNCFKP